MRVFSSISNYFKSITQRDPAARNALMVFFTYPCVHALLWHRVAHFFYKIHFYFIARLISQLVRMFTMIEIHPGAKIGKCLLIDHGAGVIIGETTEIGDYCTIYQGVTLGGTGKDTGKRHPTIGDHVLIGAGAKVLGPFTVGSRSKIAANAVVLEEVPPDSTVVGVPGRVVRRKGQRVSEDMDQIHIPDPVSQELCKMRMELEFMQARLQELTNEKEKNNNEAV